MSLPVHLSGLRCGIGVAGAFGRGLARRRRLRGGTRVARRGDPTAATAATAAADVAVDADVDAAIAVEVERRLGAPVYGRVDHFDPAVPAPGGRGGAQVRPVPLRGLLECVYVVWKFLAAKRKQ